MPKNSTIPARRPRNSVAVALATRAQAGAGKHTKDKRRQNAERRDLQGRVREASESFT